MTFRTRILVACVVVAAAPLMILAAGARNVIHDRLTMQYNDRMAASERIIRAGLARDAAELDSRLHALATAIVEEPSTRAALVNPATTAALLDYAQDAMAVAGLDYLLLFDGNGTVLSSGHFRNDYGRPLPALLSGLSVPAGVAVVTAHRPTGPFTALVRARSFGLAGRTYTLAGGMEVDSAFVSRLAGGSDVTVALDYPGGRVAGSGGVAEGSADDVLRVRVPVAFIDAAGVRDDAGTATSEAAWTITHSLAPLREIVALVDRWFMVALAAALLFAFVMARLASARVTRPLEQLARNASRVELTSYDTHLAMKRRDEVGSLSRLLDRMVQRLRTGAHLLRESERRATVGDMARQVNHDIRNGLLPIRNVIRHLAEVAEQSPDELRTVFQERAGTLQGGIGYLENLATNYARLTPRTERQPCDVNALLEDLRNNAALPGDGRISLDLARSLPRALADPVALRRVVENLVINALESLHGPDGRVSLRTDVVTGDEPGVMVMVSDNGAGIEPDAVDRIFDDFYTTKERGTGLGLSIVRRLVTDMGGRVRVESVPGSGTTFVVQLETARMS